TAHAVRHLHVPHARRSSSRIGGRGLPRSAHGASGSGYAMECHGRPAVNAFGPAEPGADSWRFRSVCFSSFHPSGRDSRRPDFGIDLITLRRSSMERPAQPKTTEKPVSGATRRDIFQI